MTYRHGRGPRAGPSQRESLSFPANFLRMVFGEDAEIDPALERAMDVLFILHVDHEQNCSTSAMRGVGSSHADPYSSAAAASAALYGPLHGGANEAVLKMLTEIGSLDNVPGFLEEVKAGGRRLMGFGHRVYKSYDPRAKIIKKTAYEVFEITGKNPKIDIALELERVALQEDYFVQAPALPERGFLLRDHLRGARVPGGTLPGALRGAADVRLARPVAGDAGGSGAEDRAAEAVVSGVRGAAGPAGLEGRRPIPSERAAAAGFVALRSTEIGSPARSRRGVPGLGRSERDRPDGTGSPTADGGGGRYRRESVQ